MQNMKLKLFFFVNFLKKYGFNNFLLFSKKYSSITLFYMWGHKLLIFFFPILLFAKTYEISEDEIKIRSIKHKFTYIRLGVGTSFNSSDQQVMPSLGLGKRFQYNYIGFDISGNWMAKNFKTGSNEYYFSIPKILLLFFLTPKSNFSFFFGFGPSYGMIVSPEKGTFGTPSFQEEKRFRGIMAEGTLGLEIAPKHRVKSFIGFDIAYPLAASSETEDKIDRPVISASFSIAF